jgi:uncharacterized small protein (DUF1192 family)
MLATTRLTIAAITLLGTVAMAGAPTAPDPTHHPATPAPAAAPGGAMPAPAGMAGAMPMMDMSKMMQMMRGMMMSGGAGMSMMAFEHVEGRIAFLKAELAITDAQLPKWNAFADTLRAGAKSMQETMSKMMQGGMPATAPARADAMVQMMASRLEGMKAVASAGKLLYDVLTDAQKKVADELMSAPMGRM